MSRNIAGILSRQQHRHLLSQQRYLSDRLSGWRSLYLRRSYPGHHQGGTSGNHQQQYPVLILCASLVGAFWLVDALDYYRQQGENSTRRRRIGAVVTTQCHGTPVDSRREELSAFIQSIKSQTKKHNLPVYTSQDVAKHNGEKPSVLDGDDSGDSDQIWMSYAGYVYNVTSFIPHHPGGTDRISRAAGKAMEPFWYLHQQHYESQEPMEILDQLVIGKLAKEDQAKIDQELEQLQQDIESFQLEVDIEDVSGTIKTQTLSLDDLKALPRTDLTSKVGCDSQNDKPRPSALFGGVLLKDLVPNETSHVLKGVTLHAMDGESVTVTNYNNVGEDYGRILVSYEENGAPLSHARGFPLRVIIPGRRVVKWVKRIEIL